MEQNQISKSAMKETALVPHLKKEKQNLTNL